MNEIIARLPDNHRMAISSILDIIAKEVEGELRYNFCTYLRGYLYALLVGKVITLDEYNKAIEVAK